MIFDTDIVVWHLRGDIAASQLIDQADGRAISIISYMELLQGARNRSHLHGIKRLIDELAFSVLPLSESIGYRASTYVEEYGLQSDMDIADTLIAATAVEHQMPLCTGNQKHYRIIKGLEIKPFRP